MDTTEPETVAIDRAVLDRLAMAVGITPVAMTPVGYNNILKRLAKELGV